MKISILINNHNQNELVKQTIEVLNYQHQKPHLIYVCSDDKSFTSNIDNVVCIDRDINHGLEEFLCSDSDALIVLGGDCYPSDKKFIMNYEEHLEQFDLVYGMKEYSNPERIAKLPLDLGIENIDNLWKNKQLNLEDIREYMNVVNRWQNTFSSTEKLDMIVSGNVGWNGNFGITKKALFKLKKFIKSLNDNRQIMDFSDDLKFCLEAFYSGLKIWMASDVKVVQKISNRKKSIVEEQFDSKLILSKLKKLDSTAKVKDRVYTSMIILFGVYIAGLITGLVTCAINLL